MRPEYRSLRDQFKASVDELREEPAKTDTEAQKFTGEVSKTDGEAAKTDTAFPSPGLKSAQNLLKDRFYQSEKDLTRQLRALPAQAPSDLRAAYETAIAEAKRREATKNDVMSDASAGGKYRGAVQQISDTPMSNKLADPDFTDWAAKRGVTPTDGARRDYDAQQIDALGKHVTKNWLKGVTFRRTENAAEIPNGARMSIGNNVDNVVPRELREPFWGAFKKAQSDYEKTHNGKTPLSNGHINSDAYYIYDIIDDRLTNIKRFEINDANRDIISRFDREHKSEIYKGAEFAAHEFAKFWRENVGLLGNSARSGNGKAAVSDALVDVKAGLVPEKISRSERNNGRELPLYIGLYFSKGDSSFRRLVSFTKRNAKTTSPSTSQPA